MSEWVQPTPRSRTRKDRAAVFMKTDGRCWKCGQRLAARGWVEEHVVPLADGGADDIGNKMPSCVKCATEKTSEEATVRAKVKRVRDRHIGAMPKSRRPMPGGRDSPWKNKVGGGVVRR